VTIIDGFAVISNVIPGLTRDQPHLAFIALSVLMDGLKFTQT